MKYRSRKHILLLYPEDETHMLALEYIKQNYQYCYILHDKDKNELGELKKPHFHLIVSFPHAVWNTALCRDLKIPENYCQQIGNYELALEYLIHYNEPEKHQYDIEEVKGPLKQKLVKILNNDNRDENEKTLSLIQLINDFDGHLSITEFSNICATLGLWAEFRRASSIYFNIIQEHNERVDKDDIRNRL